MSFDSLGLSAELLRAISDQGYDAPSAIQAEAIPTVLAGHDLMAGAQTGTGKTAAFTLPMLQNLMATATGGPRRVRALVLAPTRELADQVGKSIRTYGRHLPLRCAEVYGGMPIGPQIRFLRSGVDVLVATPGRLIDHLDRGTVDLSAVQMFVLDEADRMLDMGFMPDIERLLGELPHKRQTLLFSATFSRAIKALAHELLDHPKLIEAASPNAAAESVSQSAYFVDAGRKRELLAHLIDTNAWRQVLVFTRTKLGADRLARDLERDGIRTAAIHGDKNQQQRSRALAAFKRQSVQALIATDVAARGIDIHQLPHVVNYELPTNPEDYVHRIGRTGRGGNSGEAISLVCAEEGSRLAAINRLLKTRIASSSVEGFEPKRPVRVDQGRDGNRGKKRPHRGHSRFEQRGRPNGGAHKRAGDAPRKGGPRRSNASTR
ncbi:MAG: DEAD/DEAH box helicase [Gammaproteobacteria bacterium]|nr:DEAD/DEAH box helicase [Gammaproteobacteria bacterium]